jgi:hypothetical protein
MKSTVEGRPEKAAPKTFPLFFGPALPSQIVHEMRGMHVKLVRNTKATVEGLAVHHGDVTTAVRSVDGNDIWCYVKFESGSSGNIELGELDACDCRG